MTALKEKLDKHDVFSKYNAAFGERTKEYKEKKTACFTVKGKGTYGAF